MGNKIDVYGELNSRTGEGKLADASQIWDSTQGKFQDEINQETANDGLVSAKIEQEFTDEEKAQGRENIGAVGFVDNGAYDVTANNDNIKFVNLADLLGRQNLNTLIPTTVRKGGMSIKFVHSSDNKYVQYRFMLSEFTAAQFTNTANWQGVDDEPTAGSDNLVKSGGTVEYVDDIYLKNCLYLEKSSVINTNDAIKSFRELTSALEDIVILSKHFNFDTYNYGVYKITNGVSVSSNLYGVYICRYPKEESPSLSNIVVDSSFISATKPENGWINLMYGQSVVAKCKMNWDAFESTFGNSEAVCGVGIGVIFNQEYLKGNIYTLEKAEADIDKNTSDIETLKEVCGLVEEYKRSDFYKGYTDLRNKVVGDTITLPPSDEKAYNSTGNISIKVLDGDIVEISNFYISDGYNPRFRGYVVTDDELKILDINTSVASISAETFTINEDGYIIFQFSSTEYANNANIKVVHRKAEAEQLASEKYVEEYVDANINNKIDVCIPDEIHAVVGDTLQLFYHGIFKCVDYRGYDINITCDIGNQYPRYYQVTPTSTQVGEHTFTVTIKDNNNKVLGTKVSKIVVCSVNQPSNSVNILCVGASAMNNGAVAAEFKRRLTMSGGTPAGSALSNINFVGREEVEYASITVKEEATGGFSWNSYNTNTTRRVFFYVTDALSIDAPVGSVYTANGYNFTVKELNPTNNYFSCDIDDTTATISWESGTLTKVSGTGDSTIAFNSSRTVGNPFVNPSTGSVDISWYANEYCNNKIDVVFVQLFYNEASAYMINFNTMLSGMQTFINNFKTAFANIKICVAAIYTPDPNGGMGRNYGATDFAHEYGVRSSALLFCNALQKYINDNNLGSYVYIWNCLNEFDSEYNMQMATTTVNTRNTTPAEIGINGVHPAESGYYQNADAAYRLFIAKFCQS